MKRRGFLAIFILATLLTATNFWIYDGQGFFSVGTLPLQIFSDVLMKLAVGPLSCFPVEYGVVCPSVTISNFLFLILAVLDFLFWFLVLSAGWFIFRKLTK